MSTQENMKKDTLIITGMGCITCANNIEVALRLLDGVYEATIDFIAERLIVQYYPSKVDRSSIDGVITSLGFGIIEKN